MITHKTWNTEKYLRLGYVANFPIIKGNAINTAIIIFVLTKGVISKINPALIKYISSVAAENDT